MSHGVTLPFTVEAKDGPRPLIAAIETTVIAGWTGRDKAAMEHHMAELEAIGVKRPASTPVYYRVGCARLCQRDAIEASGQESSGEAEPVIVEAGGESYVGLGSDHTDRRVEAYGITVSKQMCDKPIGRNLWPLAEVLGHWDSLILRSYAEGPGPRRLYQEGALAAMLPVAELIRGFTGGAARLPDGTLMFCGTLPAIGGVKPAAAFALELEDPVLGRTLRHAYRVVALAIAG
jgi:hypothetical protein